jgi:ATP-dependent helicase HrpB
VAETSVTIEGVTGVVDTGVARVMRLDPMLGLNRLEIERISLSSADQRAGRAGRTAPGVCLRLWTERQQQALAAFDTPEVQRVDLAGPALELLCWGERDLANFPWYEKPPAAALEQALALLRRLGAIDAGGVTRLGRSMARLPVHPRLARLLVEGHRLGCVERTAIAAALLAERDPFVRSERRAAVHRSSSDLLDRVQALEDFVTNRQRHTELGALDPQSARFILRASEQLAREVHQELGPEPAAKRDVDEAFDRAVFTAFADRLARRREPGGRRALLVGGRGVRLDERSAVTEAELFVAVELAEQGGSESLVRLASAVDRAWLRDESLSVSIEIRFDEQRQRVTAARVSRYEDLVLDETPAAMPNDDRAAALLAVEAAARFERIGPEDESALQFLARARSLAAWLPELELPDFNDDALRALLPQLCAGCTSLAELRSAPWRAVLEAQLTPTQRQAVEREAPERIEVPSGSRIALHYEAGKPPVLAVRIQEVFGLMETPRVARGRVPVLMHLLAPNYRPQQITGDLASFWARTYAEVRKELKRRYPKHAWPEDPYTATAERRPGQSRR